MANHNILYLEGILQFVILFLIALINNYWNARYYIIWEGLEYGPYVSTKFIKFDGKSDQIIPKPREEYDEEDKRYLSLNARVKNLLYCTLDKNEFTHHTSTSKGGNEGAS